MGVILVGAAMRSHSRGTDAVPRPHSLRVPVTDCVRGRDGLSSPHERAIKLARGAYTTRSCGTRATPEGRPRHAGSPTDQQAFDTVAPGTLSKTTPAASFAL